MHNSKRLRLFNQQQKKKFHRMFMLLVSIEDKIMGMNNKMAPKNDEALFFFCTLYF